MSKDVKSYPLNPEQTRILRAAIRQLIKSHERAVTAQRDAGRETVAVAVKQEIAILRQLHIDLM